MRYFDGERWGSVDQPLGSASTPSRSRSRWRLPVLRRRARRTDEPSRRTATIVGIVIVVALTAAVALLQRSGGTSRGRAASSASTAADDRPPPSREERARPIGAPAPVPAGTGQFEFLETQPSEEATPVAFDPCRPVHYVVNLDGAPSDASTLIADAIRRVSIATGLRFVDDGTTTETPGKNRLAYQPDRYGRRWAPVLVAWSDEKTFPSLAGYIAGVTEPHPVLASRTHLVYVTGQIVLDREQLSPAASPDRGVVRAIVLHELGHLVGLDHTSDHTQIMFSESQFDVRDYGDGDLRGLAQLGTQACFRDV